MARQHGRNGAVYLSNGGAPVQVAAVSKWTLAIASEVIDLTAPFADPNKVYGRTLPDIKGSFAAWWTADPDDAITSALARGATIALFTSAADPVPIWTGYVLLDYTIDVGVTGGIAIRAEFVPGRPPVTAPLTGAAILALVALGAIVDPPFFAGAASLTGTAAAVLEPDELSGAAALSLSGAGIFLEGEDSVTTLTTTATGTIDNFNPGILGSLNILRCNNASLLTITGLTNNGAAPADGTMVWLESIGAGQVDLANQAAGSTAAHRLINQVTATISLAAGNGRALIAYDATTGRWRVLAHEQGAWITVPYASGKFTAVSGTWAVGGGFDSTVKYHLQGRTVTVAFSIINSTIAGSPVYWLRIEMPNGFLHASPMSYIGVGHFVGGGTGPVSVAANDLGYLTLEKAVLAAWSGNTALLGEAVFEVQ